MLANINTGGEIRLGELEQRTNKTVSQILVADEQN